MASSSRAQILGYQEVRHPLKTILTGKIKGKRGQHSWLHIGNWCDVAATLLRRRFALCDKHMYAYTLH